MKFFALALILIFLCSPSFARPFKYNFSLGPEYFYFTSHKSSVSSNLVSCGVVCAGNILNVLNTEIRGGFGEISSTKLNFNEVSLLYNIANRSNHFLGLGVSYLTYNNSLDKTNNINIEKQALNAKFQWEYSFSSILGLYLRATGPWIWSYELGWLAYFDKDLGDFNLRMGYKELRLDEESSMSGIYVASSIYF